MLYNKVTYGKIWKGKTWKFAINSIHKNHDGRIITRKKYKNISDSTCNKIIFDGYSMEADSGHKSYITRIPKELSDYVEKLTGLKREFK